MTAGGSAGLPISSRTAVYTTTPSLRYNALGVRGKDSAEGTTVTRLVKALSYRTVKGGICFHVEQFVEFRGWYLLHGVQVVLSESRLVELSGE
jgi:hypothetical protein